MLQYDIHTSGYKTIKAGVPQGSILGLLLSLMFTNELPNFVENGYIAMYADNIVLQGTKF